MALHKAEAALLTRELVPLDFNINVGEQPIGTSKAVKYLGVWLDSKLNINELVSRSCAKASKVVSNLSRLMNYRKERRLLIFPVPLFYTDAKYSLSYYSKNTERKIY